jgi:hypothetical protein
MSEYCQANRLALQTSKTTFLKFHMTIPKSDSSPLIRLEGATIRRESTVKFLGLTITETLDWQPHTNTIATKLLSCCYMLRRIKSCVSQHTSLLVYHSYFHSILSYAILFWGNSHHARRIFIIQKRAVRILAGISRRQSCKSHFTNLNILTLTSTFILNTAMFVHNNPDLFYLNKTHHSHHTRNNNSIFITPFTHSFYKHSPYYLCSKIYNKLPSNISEYTTTISFRTKLQAFLIKKAYYNLSEFLQ